MKAAWNETQGILGRNILVNYQHNNKEEIVICLFVFIFFYMLLFLKRKVVYNKDKCIKPKHKDKIQF